MPPIFTSYLGASRGFLATIRKRQAVVDCGPGELPSLEFARSVRCRRFKGGSRTGSWARWLETIVPVYARKSGDPHRRTSFGPTWKMHNRSAAAADVYRDNNFVDAKLMLNAGRAKELAATYDSPVGLLSLRPNEAVRVDQLHEAAVVALALRRAGRPAEADRLLSKATSTLRRSIVSDRPPLRSTQMSPRSGPFKASATKPCQCSSGPCGGAGATAVTRTFRTSPMSPLSFRCAPILVSSGSGQVLRRILRESVRRSCSCASEALEGGQGRCRHHPVYRSLSNAEWPSCSRQRMRNRRLLTRGDTNRSALRWDQPRRSRRHRHHHCAPAAGAPSAHTGFRHRSVAG